MKSRTFFFLASALAAAQVASAETVERIVAMVNGQIITLSQLEQEVRTTLERLGPAPTPEEEETRLERIRPETLDRMIDNLLVLQVAEERGLRVPARFFEEWKKNVMEEMKLTSDEEFERQVELQGTTVEAIRKNFEESLLLQEVRRMEVDSKVSVSEPEIGERYREHIAEYTEPARIRLREIVVKFDAATEVDQGQKARRLLQEIQQGADFAEVARMHSESSSREAGGDLGTFDKSELTDVLANAAFALSPGEVSEVIRMPSAFYILRVEEKTEEKVKTLEEVRSEVADAIFQEKMNAQLQRYIQQLRERAIVEVKL
ncbi:MAG TPA: peptidyl-prolyl cis-trans isomerase [Vicinamibacteria bacterium]